MGKNTCPVSMKTSVQVPNTRVKSQALLWQSGAPALLIRDRQMLRVHWPAYLAEMVSFWLRERPCLEAVRRGRQRKTPGILLWPPHAHLRTHTHAQHTYTPQSHTHKAGHSLCEAADMEGPERTNLCTQKQTTGHPFVPSSL